MLNRNGQRVYQRSRVHFFGQAVNNSASSPPLFVSQPWKWLLDWSLHQSMHSFRLADQEAMDC